MPSVNQTFPNVSFSDPSPPRNLPRLQAESLFRRALAIFEKSYGRDHPATAMGLSGLAGSLVGTNCLGEAEPLYQRALAIDEASYGPDHPQVAIDLSNLAELLRRANRFAEAEPVFRRALAIFEKSYVPDHPLVEANLGRLTELLRATNRLGEAEPLLRHALAIDEARFGPDHHKVAEDLNNLAECFEPPSASMRPSRFIVAPWRSSRRAVGAIVRKRRQSSTIWHSCSQRRTALARLSRSIAAH